MRLLLHDVRSLIGSPFHVCMRRVAFLFAALVSSAVFPIRLLGQPALFAVGLNRATPPHVTLIDSLPRAYELRMGAGFLQWAGKSRRSFTVAGSVRRRWVLDSQVALAAGPEVRWSRGGSIWSPSPGARLDAGFAGGVELEVGPVRLLLDGVLGVTVSRASSYRRPERSLGLAQIGAGVAFVAERPPRSSRNRVQNPGGDVGL